MSSPVDYHNSNAELVDVVPVRINHPVMSPADVEAMEMRAFEKGRMQGEIEAVRRIEQEGPQQKAFVQENVVTAANSQPDLIEINQLTFRQWASAILGELFTIGAIVLMAIWIDQYRSGVGWDNSDQNGSRGMFDVHVITSFVGLWFVAQAYITYRLLPIGTPTAINKGLYIFSHLCALACFAITIASSTMSNPSTRAWSMHAWVSYLTVAIYATHAIYSIFKVLVYRHGIPAGTWNESKNYVGDRPAGLTPEQIRDGEVRPATMYRAGPSSGVWKRMEKERALDLDARNANHGNAHPQWSEQASYPASRFFLVPRAKWATVSLFGLMASVLIGLAEWQMLLRVGRQNWVTDSQSDSEFSDFGNESIIIGCLGLATAIGICLIGYAAMPPRTTLAKGGVSLVENRRTSISTGSTVQNTRIGNEYERDVAVV
jgi:hypothetical protein